LIRSDPDAMPDDEWLSNLDGAFLAVSFFIEAVLLGNVLLHMVKRSDSILAHANQFWKGALEAARQLWKQIVGFEDPQVEEEVCKHILQTYKQYPPILVMSTLGSVVAFQWSMIVGRVMVIPRALCWMILLTLSIGLLLTFQRDRLIKRHTLDYWYCFGALLCTLQLLPGVVPETERLLWSMVTFCFYRLPAVAMAPRLSWAIVANLTYTVVSVVGISLDTEHRTYANGGDRVYVAFWLEALLLILVVGAAFSQRYSVKAFVKQRMLRAIMERELVAATSLLHLTCDAVVELGEDLRLTKHSPNLATMLLRNAPGSTLEGIHFRDFLPPAEVARAEELLCQSVEVGGQAAAQAFHTRMVDSCASQFRTEVFHVRYVDWNGATRHLIGLRDFTDQASLAQARATDAMMEMVAPVPAVPPMLPPLLPLLEEGITWHSPKVKAADSLQVKMSDSLKVKMSDTLAIQQELNLLEIDMTQLVVSAASVSVDFLVGKQVSEIFQGEGVKLLTQIHELATMLEQEGQLSSRTFSYGDCALS